jgi:O-antigen ligase
MRVFKNSYSRILDIIISILVLFALCTVFFIYSELGNSRVSGKYFWFYFSVASLAVVAIPVAIARRKEPFRFVLNDLLMLLFCCSALAVTLIHIGKFTNRCFLLGLLGIFYFYLRIFLSGKSKLVAYLLVMFFMFTGLVEAVWGLRQLYGFTASHHHLFKTTGSFFNPGPYSGWLAMVFPMALWYAISGFTKQIPKEKFVFNRLNITAFIKTELPEWIMIVTGGLTVTSILLILPAAMSRASWLATLGGSAFIAVIYGIRNKTFLDYFRKYRKRVFVVSVIAIVLFAVSMVGLFLLKKDSASGRAFTWKITVQTIKEHPLGVGLGNFGGAYGDVQAAYFASGAGTEREEYVAEGVEYAFNEYLQICIETGIVPFLIFLAFVVYTLVLGVRNKNYLPAGSLVSLLIFASMSYPFNVLPFVIAFVFLSTLCVSNNTILSPKKIRVNSCNSWIKWSFIIVAPFIVGLCIYKVYPSYEAYKQWKLTQMLYHTNAHKEAAEEFSKQYPYLQDEIQFLFGYAQCLSKTSEYEKSNEVLQDAMQISCDPMLYNVMGKNYQSLLQYEHAEQSFKKAANLVPNRLYPHYLLAKLYHEMGLLEKAESEANIVLTKPPKVDSKAGEEMREELKELLRS